MAKTRRGRLKQIERWLRKYYPCPHPVRVTVKRMPKPYDYGETYRYGRRLIINISSTPTWYFANELLIHEWAHAASWPHAILEARRPQHDEEWAVMYGRIYRHFYDDGGAEESRDF